MPVRRAGNAITFSIHAQVVSANARYDGVKRGEEQFTEQRREDTPYFKRTVPPAILNLCSQ